VAAGDRNVPDWRDATAYEPLLGADRSLLAWEWLRRDPAYRTAAERALSGSGCDPSEPGQAPERWGLHAFEAPGVTAPEARPVWCAEVHPYVLGVEATSGRGGDAFDLARLGSISTLLTTADGREHLLVCDGLRSIRIDVMAGSIARGPAELRYRLSGLTTAERPLLTLRRFLALWRTGRFCRSLHAHEARAKRWVLALRAYDALAGGASQRAIAAELLGGGAARTRWRVKEPSLRSRAQRLAQNARSEALGGFRKLLL
jgi:hypothetical protein